ncbi:sensor histidine kinase [Arenibacterium sp. CAU 1754]
MRDIERQKWRPSLWVVLGGALAGTLVLSVAGLVIFRYLGPDIGYKRAAVLLTLMIGALTAVPWFLLLRLLLRPMTALSDYAAATRLSPGRPADLPGHFGTRELHDMGQSVIDMAYTLQNREATIRTYTDHVTHELKTPVSAIRAATELLEDSTRLTEQDRALVGQIAGAGHQIEAQLDALRQAAAARAADHHGHVRLGDIIDEITAAHGDLEIHVSGETIVLPLSAKGLRIVLDHLLENARAHGATAVDLTVSNGRLTVTDNGRGISDGNRDHVFEPFFTTRRETGGTGMGLAIVDSLLRAHGGRITLAPGGPGATFDIRFAQGDRR